MSKTKTARPGQFQPGQSGNPAGRPVGSRNKATIAAAALLEGEVEQLTRKAVELALGGDTTALRLCIERIIPPAKDRPINVSLPACRDASGVAEALESVLQSVAGGELTPSEGSFVSVILERRRSALETKDLDQRLTELEERLKKK
jgi:hypothetical protein